MNYDTFGPWIGVPTKNQSVCAAVDCIAPGKRRACFYDGTTHHHGCIHYNCSTAKKTEHGIVFREGWGYLCDMHTEILFQTYQRWIATRSSSKDAL